MAQDDQRRGKYLGFVAHEIKNPLATALWSCDLLKRMDAADRSGERAAKMVDVSLRALRRMRRLIEDHFTIERLLEHGYELRREPQQLAELVSSAVQVLAEKDGIQTSAWSVEVAGGNISGDGEMLRRALRALFEHLSRGAGANEPRLRISGAARAEGGCTLRAEAVQPPTPLYPPPPEDRPSGDPTGAVLGFKLAEHILAVHEAKLEERDGGLVVTFLA